MKESSKKKTGSRKEMRKQQMQQNIHGGDIYSRPVRLESLGKAGGSKAFTFSGYRSCGGISRCRSRRTDRDSKSYAVGAKRQGNSKGVSAVWQRGIRTFSGDRTCT